MRGTNFVLLLLPGAQKLQAVKNVTKPVFDSNQGNPIYVHDGKNYLYLVKAIPDGSNIATVVNMNIKPEQVKSWISTNGSKGIANFGNYPAFF